jgi:3-oxoacyl-[acyl-carrier protein] reductase
MNIDFTGKHAVVCGGSRGIGRAIALAFAAAGGSVSICARSADALEQTRGEIAQYGHTAHAAATDVADASAVRGYIQAAGAALGGIDFLVNNASAFGSSDDEKGWGTSMAIDMMAIVHATQEALPLLKQSKGSVLNISSIAAMHTAARQPPYGAIKAAVIHYTGTQAAMYAKDGIRVNCIAPGLDRVPRRRLGPAQVRQSPPLQRRPQLHPVRPARPPRGNRQRGAVPGLAVRILGHRPDHRG